MRRRIPFRYHWQTNIAGFSRRVSVPVSCSLRPVTDKAWYADRDPNTNEPKTTAQMFFTVYYAEKGDKMLHHFQGKIDMEQSEYK